MNRCAICKGHKLLCGRSFCPILRKLRIVKSVYSSLKIDREVFGESPPYIFVGEAGYPQVRVAPSVALDGASLLSNPLEWENITLDEALKRRSMLIMGEKSVHVNSSVDFDSLVMSIKPVDSEMILSRRPTFKINLNETAPLINPKAKLEKLRVVDNPKVPNYVERIVNDDIKAGESIISLYEKGFDEYYIIRLLSAGLLGIKRRLVPTRWSITAVEDKIGERIKGEIIHYNPIDKFELYHSEFLGNRYTVLLIPDSYAFELLEVWLPESIFGFSGVLRDYEFFKRREYAKETSGAYYSARLSVLEFLRKRKRQARVVVFREITQEYYIPIGSWQIRVGVKKALENKIADFDNLFDIENLLRGILRHPLEDYLKRSVILKNRTLTSWIEI